MFIHDIADFLVNLTCKDIKPDIYSVFDSPCENNCPNNVNSEKLTILEILNAIGCRLKNLFGFVKINTTTETIDESEAAVNVSGDVDNLNFDFKIPRGKTGPAGAPGPAGPGVAPGGTTGQVLAKKSNTNYDTEWIDNSGGGSTVSVNVGKTTTGEPGTNASVTNSGDETNVILNFTIPRGDTGPQGPQGKQGPAGAPGPAGPGVASGGTTGQVLAKKSNTNYDTEWIDNSGGGSTVSVNVGKTTTGEPGTNASVTNSGDETNVILNFTIPRGDTGPQGPQGKQGPAGAPGPAGPGVASGGTTGQVLAKKSNTNYDTEWIDNSGGGSTVSVNVGKTTTGEPGTNASVTNSGDETNVILNFTIPRGDTGPQGPQGKQGPAGAPGPAGPGVASGGTTGQVLAKKSNTNYDTEWINFYPYVPVGGVIEWDGTGIPNAPDLSTPEKVAAFYGYGTWARYGVDRITVGAGGEYAAGSTGGEKTHTLTVEEMPSHNHNALYGGGSGSQYGFTIQKNSIPGQYERYALQNTGGSQPHNNMPPYVGTYKYRRIS